MIVDDRVLKADFQPREILHRDGEIDHLVSVLEPGRFNAPPEGAFIYGPTGAGKTCTSKFVLEQLEDQFESVTTISINCFQDHDRRHVLHRFLTKIDPATTLNRRNTAVGDLTEALRSNLDGRTVVLLDEADQLDDFRTLRDLYELPKTTMVLIANQPHHLLGNIDSTLDSRIGTIPQINFEPYPTDAIVDILEARVEAGVRSGVVSDSNFDLIADIVSGDARKAIVLLRRAVKRAASEGSSHVAADHIHNSIGAANRDIARARVSSLTRDQRIVLEVLAEEGPASTGEIRSFYAGRVDDPKSERTLRRWIREKFIQYNLVTIHEDGAQPTYNLTQAAEDAFEDLLEA